MNNNIPIISSCLWIVGDLLDPNEVSRILSTKPDETGIKGDDRGARRPKVPETFWRKEFRDNSFSLDEVVSKTIIFVRPEVQYLRNYAAENDLSISIACSIHTDCKLPELYLSPNTIIFLASIKCDFSIDIFN